MTNSGIAGIMSVIAIALDRQKGEMMGYRNILKNEHFRRLAAVIRVPFRSQSWRRDHPDVPVWDLLRRIDHVTPIDGWAWDRKAVIKAFTDFLTAVVSADDGLSYTTGDVRWLVETFDGSPDVYRPTILLLKGYYSAADDMVTTGEAARLSGEAESTWRNRAAAGQVPGAEKKGKTWLLPKSMIVDRIPKIDRIRRAIDGNVFVSPRDVHYVYGTSQDEGDRPRFIHIRVFSTGTSMTEEEWEDGVERRDKIVQMLEDAGIGGFDVHEGTIHFLND